MWFDQVAFDVPFDDAEYLLVRWDAEVWPPDDAYEQVEDESAPDLVTRALLDGGDCPRWGLLRLLAIEEHPRNMSAGELHVLVARRLRGTAPPRLMKQTRPIRNLMLQSTPTPAAPPKPMAAPPPRGYVLVEIVTEQDQPASNVRCELELANGEVRSATSDGRGRILLDPIPQGRCRIRLPALDASSWRAAEGSAPATVETGRALAHTVAQGNASRRSRIATASRSIRGSGMRPKTRRCAKSGRARTCSFRATDCSCRACTSHRSSVPRTQPID